MRYLAMLTILLMPLTSFGWGKFKITPKVNPNGQDVFAIDTGLIIDEPISILNYDGYFGLDNTPSPGPGYSYNLVMKHGIYLEAGNLRVSPAFRTRYFTTEGFWRNEVELGISYKLWD